MFQAEQRVRYVADGSGYHGAVAVTTSDHDHIHTTNFALGDRALQLTSQIPPQTYNQQITNNGTQAIPDSNLQDGQTPLQIFLLRGQYPVQNHFFQVIPDNPVHLTSVPNFYLNNNQDATPSYYNLNVEHTRDDRQYAENNVENKPNNRATHENDEEIIETKENGPVVRVFKDHNCPNDDLNYNNNLQNQHENHFQQPAKYNHETPHSVHGNFGERDFKQPTSQAINNYKIDEPDNRNERYYYSTEISHSTTSKPVILTEEEGISRLVASTQDLITNEDLLRINHAAERAVSGYGDDYIKPKRKLNSKSIVYNGPTQAKPRSRITVSAKIGNIVDSRIEHPKSYREPSAQVIREPTPQSYETTNNDYRFASPIIVADPKYGNYKQQIVNNLVSTMVPYIQDGYEIVGVRNSLNENNTGKNEENKSGEDLVNITPRPISQSYLAPITVALRLLNLNDSEIFNTVDDHEASDSELIEKTVENPENGKTIVEIQESIPVEITHINDVEYHEYLDEGRSNNGNPYGIVKSIYQKYLQNLESNTYAQNQHDSNPKNQNSDYYETSNNEDSKETLESSENIQSEVQVQANTDNRNAYANYYNAENGDKIIQPIIIEKQVPVTAYVDRFIEKKVPYPEPVEVVKQVPVDRPVPVPVRYETIVEKPVEVTKYVDKPYPVEVYHSYPVEVRVPYPVEHKVYVDRPVHVPYPIEKVIEKQVLHPVPIPTPVGIPFGIQVPVEKKVLYPVHIATPVPVAVPVEKHIPVEKIVEKEVPVPYPVEKQVPYPVRHEVKVPVPYPVEKRIPVPVEVHVPKPYPVDRIIEKKIPYPVTVEKIVERKVHVKVPYPVKTFVEKIIEKPVVVTKYVDKPYPVEKRVPYPVEKIIERKVPYPVHVPVAVKVPYQVENNVQKPDVPYPFEKVEKQTIYTYGVNQEVLSNVANYLRYNQEQYKQPLPSYVQNNDFNTQQHAESQRNYQIQLANAQILRNIQNTTPAYSKQWGNQYAATYQYSNSTSDKKLPETVSHNQGNNKYFGPLPLRNYEGQWEKNKDYTERIRRTDRTPKVSNLRIEYGGFKPPLIPSTEIDLDGLPINKSKEHS
ncbi:jg1399 [Pararge aegeria aegeria]|uniref:Jg1399 protein n=1 Tax=Pararge aegeria aegeria TaxID=348720 RepID=A0A8S4RGM4_9NEOP|nr:jg1399 [Pararge aegeria aegeria]